MCKPRRKPITKAQLRRRVDRHFELKAIESYLSECFTGYMLVGYNAFDDSPMVISDMNDADDKTKMALRGLIKTLVNSVYEDSD